ncbi:MAG: nuclear transport factor 2 family protein [Alphaproteobacteria bacterium]
MGHATDIARNFLDLFQARDLAGAAKLVTADFVMVWPGNARFTKFEDLAAWGKGRYRSVRNIYEAWEEAPTADGTAVFAIGTLTGELGDGTPFSGVRFVDRMLIRDGKVAALHVWSDMADALRKLGR